MDFVPRIFYTYSIVEDDLVIHTWQFEKTLGDDELMYYNKNTGSRTIVQYHGSMEKFCEINDIFVDRVGVLADLGEVVYDDDEFELGESEMDVVINLFNEGE